MMLSKRGLEASFAWIFSIVAGSAIIFLAIYATTQFISTEREIINTETGRQIENLLTPIETNLESGRVVPVDFSVETRVFNGCRTEGNFGEQRISAATKSGIGEAWQKPGLESISYNRYLFSEDVLQGERMYLMAKNFEMPYKVASVIFVWTDNQSYCFVNPIREVEDDIKALKPENINITSSVKDCLKGDKVVCFASSEKGCDIKVFPDANRVEKEFKNLYYEDALIYGAIFADSEIYECQVKRLMKRAGELAFLYADKTEFLENRGCSSNLGNELRSYSAILNNLNNSRELSFANAAADELGRRNELLSCELF